MMLYYQTKFGCKQTSSLQDILKRSYFDYISPRCDLDIEGSEPVFPHDTSPHDNTPPYQVWLKMVEQFRRYRPDKIRHTDKRPDGQSESNVLPGIYKGEGGIKKKVITYYDCGP